MLHLSTFLSARSKAEQVARSLLFGTPLFVPVRSIYQRLFNREKWLFWDRTTRFYAQFIRPGDVVFDVGANVGIYADVFSRLGATVIAVEPNAQCCQQLNRIARINKRIIVEPCAAGASVGTAEFHVCEENTMSTLNEKWLESVSKSELHSHARWLNKVEVPVRTLDVLAKQYGEPSFVKIDAEGYDDQVLAGMSFQPAALSFEFNTNGLDVALRCLSAPALRKGYLFNYTVGQEFLYGRENWLTRESIVGLLENFDLRQEYGEVLARRTR
jgi:FkbM family methyltransferase